jgi:hypothetical protein
MQARPHRRGEEVFEQKEAKEAKGDKILTGFALPTNFAHLPEREFLLGEASSEPLRAA